MILMAYRRVFLLSIILSFYNMSFATTYVIPAKDDLIGEIQYTNSEPGETLTEIGQRYDIGYEEMVKANPTLNHHSLLSSNTPIVIPTQFILPPGSRQGLVINLAEFRLYYYPPGKNVVITQPVGIGRKGWNTPVGVTHITAKQRNPVWRPTLNLQREAAKHGMPIPNELPPGPGNPLGKHILRLGWPTYLLHGTNHKEGVGARVSAGCLRMLPEDIEYLYELIKVGTVVRVINEPIKLGVFNGKVYIEVHKPLKETAVSLNEIAVKQLKKVQKNRLQPSTISQELRFPSGLPKRISV